MFVGLNSKSFRFDALKKTWTEYCMTDNSADYKTEILFSVNVGKEVKVFVKHSCIRVVSTLQIGKNTAGARFKWP